MDEEKFDFDDMTYLTEDQNNNAENSNIRRNNDKKNESSGRLELYDWVQCIVAALVIGILGYILLIRTVNVEGSSMFPTLHNADKIITTNLFYTPTAGDIVVFQTDTYGPEPLVKRIIATDGQKVSIDFDAGKVFVDGAELDEPYINAPTLTREDFTDEITVPEGYLFVMGDNRNASTDSRSKLVGLVDERCIIGKVVFIAIPGADSNRHRDFSRIGSIGK